MTKLEQLIKELCPNGVEYKTLGELGKFYGGLTGKSKDDFTDGNAKFITYKNVYSNPALQIDVTDRVKIVDGEKQRTLQYGDVIFTGSSETPDECGISSVVTVKTDERLYLNSFCFFFRFDDIGIILPDFAKHLFRSNNLRYQIGKTASGVTRFNVSKKLMENVIIPLPPLQVQSEIVRILDNFTELTAELTAELIERKQQYECYKQRLFSSVKEEAVELGSIADFSQGLQVDVNKQYQEIKSNCIRFLRIVDFVSDNEPPRYIEKPDDRYIKNDGELIMIRYGASAAGKVFIKHSGAIANNMFKINVITKNVNTKYLMYYLSQKRIYELLNKTGGKSTMPAVNFGMVSKIKIPIPSIEEQERIVAILERFDSLYNDISEGLTAEIEGRRKQYEYYRDKLLTFKEKAN